LEDVEEDILSAIFSNFTLWRKMKPLGTSWTGVNYQDSATSITTVANPPPPLPVEEQKEDYLLIPVLIFGGVVIVVILVVAVVVGLRCRMKSKQEWIKLDQLK